MSDEAALLAAIESEPDEDTPRLIYADWLDEFADSMPDPTVARIRAEFIRVQCQIRRLDDPFRTDKPVLAGTSDDLWRRQEYLLENHGRELLGPLASLSYFDATLERGFLAELDLSVRLFLKHFAYLETLSPRPRIRLHSLTADLGSLGSAAVRRALACVSVCRVQHSYEPLVSGRVSQVAALCPHFTGLSHFDFSDCGLEDFDFERLLKVLVLPNLIGLDLGQNVLTTAGVRMLVRSPVWGRLRSLSLRGNWQLGDEAAQLLASAPRDRLENLSISLLANATAGRQALQARFGERVVLGSASMLE